MKPSTTHTALTKPPRATSGSEDSAPQPTPNHLDPDEPTHRTARHPELDHRRRLTGTAHAEVGLR